MDRLQACKLQPCLSSCKQHAAVSTNEECTQQCIHPSTVCVCACCWDQAGDKKGSTWEHILKADDFKRRSFSDIDRNNDGFVDAKVRLQQRHSGRPPPIVA